MCLGQTNQGSQIKETDALRFSIPHPKGKIEFIKLGLDTTIQKPTILFLQGSLPVPLVFDLETRKHIHIPFSYDSLSKHFHIIEISMPHTPLIVSIDQVNSKYCYITDTTNEHAYDTNYIRDNVLDVYVDRASSVIEFLTQKTWIDSNTNDMVLDETVYSISAVPPSTILAGTGDGIVFQSDTEINIYRFWNNSATSMSTNQGFNVYPNPFVISSNGILNQDGHVRFVYFNPSNSLQSDIDIYDFSMNHVINLSQKIIIEDEATIIWNGRNSLGNRVVNGTYFCRLSIDNKEYWTKLLVIN